MSDGKSGTVELPMASWVKGGTLSSAYDKQIQREDAEAEERRRQQDAQMQSASSGLLPKHLQDEQLAPGDVKGVSRMSSMRLGGRNAAASIVLGLKHPKDNEILDWMVCELNSEPKDDGSGVELMLVMCCPRCVKTLNRHPQRAQFHIRQSNRAFWIDTAKAGEMWVNPEDPNEIHTLAGTVTTQDWIKCPNVGCNWEFKIDDSIVYTR